MEIKVLLDASIAAYAAKKLVEDIRNRERITPELAKSFYQYPLIDKTRLLIKSDDWKYVKKLCDSKNDSICSFGIGLLNNILFERSVRTYLFKLWKKPNRSMQVKIAIQFRFLDYPRIEPQLLGELVDFTFLNWKEWLLVGGSMSGVNILEFCKQRLEDKKTPQHKKWVYICRSAAHRNPKETILFLKHYHSDRDPFIRNVTNEVLRKISSKKRLIKGER